MILTHILLLRFDTLSPRLSLSRHTRPFQIIVVIVVIINGHQSNATVGRRPTTVIHRSADRFSCAKMTRWQMTRLTPDTFLRTTPSYWSANSRVLNTFISLLISCFRSESSKCETRSFVFCLYAGIVVCCLTGTIRWGFCQRGSREVRGARLNPYCFFFVTRRKRQTSPDKPCSVWFLIFVGLSIVRIRSPPGFA